jgi:TfdA family taurine catabolism dioxygenase TauD
VREDILNGKGFILFKGFPANEWGPHKSAVAYMGLGTYLGYFVSQNGRGHVLGHVKDVGEDPTQIDRVRIYRTTARQFFHTDNGDLVGLLCIHRAAEGGESDIASTHNVWNTLQREHPDVAELLTRPIWYFDRKGETSEGEEDWIRRPVFYIENGGRGRVYLKWDPYYVKSLARFSDKGLVPPLTVEQQRAATILEETCGRLALHMVLEVGDIQFLHNGHILHSRTEYKGG